MVRKVSAFICACALIMAIAMPAHGASHTIYSEGSLSSTYITYFKDIVSGIGFSDNYVAFRSGQYEYTLIVGKLSYENGVISSEGRCTEYLYKTEGTTYNSQYKYYVNDIDTFSVSTGNNIIYSDVGQFPQLVERGAKYEMLSAVLIVILLLSVVINRIFYSRRR